MNGYQSLHTTLVGPYGTPVEFQFRTRDMHHVAEEGVASHWLYKGADLTLNDLQKRTHQWLQSLLDIQSQTGDSGEFLEHVKVDLFPDAVYVFTRAARSSRCRAPVDFAYAIHTDIGNQAVAAKVNGEFVPLRTEMSSGDTVEIVTSPASRPNAQWLNYVRTGRARSRSATTCAPSNTRNRSPSASACWARPCRNCTCRCPPPTIPPGRSWRAAPAPARARKSWPTSAWASAWPPWSRAASRPSTSWSPPPPPRWTS